MSEVVTPPQTPRNLYNDPVYAANPNAEVFKIDRTQSERTFVSYDRSPDALMESPEGILTPANKLVIPPFSDFPISIINLNVDLMAGIYEDNENASELPARFIQITTASRVEPPQVNNMSGEYYSIIRNATVVINNAPGYIPGGNIDIILYADDRNDLPFASAPAAPAARLRF